MAKAQRVIVKTEVPGVVLELSQQEAQRLRALLGNLNIGYDRADTSLRGVAYLVWDALVNLTECSTSQDAVEVEDICRRTITRGRQE